VLFQLGKAQFESSARPVKLTNVYYMPDEGANLILVDRLFQMSHHTKPVQYQLYGQMHILAIFRKESYH
jgi:hypothetical protein